MSEQAKQGRPVVALMTDFGAGDGDVGVMKGVIASIVPEVQVIDITHDVAPQNVASGAWILGASYRYFPAGTVFVCVVDPGVGSERNAIALAAGGWYFVGPDNGLFSQVLVEQPARGVVRLVNPAYHLAQVSSTFHGRDIFAPVGAHLARGVSLEEVGQAFDPATLQRLSSGTQQRQEGGLSSRVIHVDHFGNLISGISLSAVPDWASAPGARVIFPDRQIVIEQRRRYFADGAEDGSPFFYGDSSGYLAVAVRNGSAARTLGVGYGDAMTFVTNEK